MSFPVDRRTFLPDSSVNLGGSGSSPFALRPRLALMLSAMTTSAYVAAFLPNPSPLLCIILVFEIKFLNDILADTIRTLVEI